MKNELLPIGSDFRALYETLNEVSSDAADALASGVVRFALTGDKTKPNGVPQAAWNRCADEVSRIVSYRGNASKGGRMKAAKSSESASKTASKVCSESASNSSSESASKTRSKTPTLLLDTITSNDNIVRRRRNESRASARTKGGGVAADEIAKGIRESGYAALHDPNVSFGAKAIAITGEPQSSMQIAIYNAMARKVSDPIGLLDSFYGEIRSGEHENAQNLGAILVARLKAAAAITEATK